MDELKAEIKKIVSNLKASNPGYQNPEQSALNYLERIAQECKTKSDISELDSIVSELRLFWLNSVAWCSPLSKDIEKIIILYEEYATAAENSPPP